MIRTILFDLDGTLACMDQNEFIRQYYQTLGQSAASQGISDPKKLLDAVTMGTYAMMPVSYTHLDVYKRQTLASLATASILRTRTFVLICWRN